MRIFGRITILIALFVPTAAHADCTCRARGLVAEHGQTMCINTPSGYRLARCDKVSNIASWTFLDGACPQIATRPSQPQSIPRS
jgi:hypothetical protein